MKILLVFLLSFLLCNQVISQPSYRIWSVITNHNINLGDTVIFDIGLSGYGYINPKFLKFTLYSDTTSKIGLQYSIYKPTEILRFESIDNPNINSLFKINSPSILIPADTYRISGQQHFYSLPTTSGDKSIKIIVTYSPDSLTWYTEESFLSFHVNTFYEEYEFYLVLIGIIIALLAAFDPITNTCTKIRSFLQRQSFQKNKKVKSK